MAGQNVDNDDDGGRQRDGWQQGGWPAAGGADAPTAQVPRPAVAPPPTVQVPRPAVAPGPVAPYGSVPQYGAVPPAGANGGPYAASPAPVTGGSASGSRKKRWSFPRLLVAAGIAVILAGGGGGAIGYAVGNAAGSHHQFSQRARLGTGGYGRHIPGSGQGGGQSGSQPTQGTTNP